MTKLSVNLNKVALLRNTRVVGIPSVVEKAQLKTAVCCNTKQIFSCRYH